MLALRTGMPGQLHSGGIPVIDGKRGEFDLDHCKGCGICVKNCPFGALEMKEGVN